MSPATVVEVYPPGLARRGNAEWKALHDTALTPNYGPRRIALVRGQGSRVWDADGKEYLDFLTGISVNNLGHCHPRVTEAIREQAGTLVHCTNLYYIPVQIELAHLLTQHCFAERVFFANSGAEANEAAIKIARRWARENRGPHVNHIVSMRGSFHGRTVTTLSATGQDKVWKNFYPLARHFYFAPFNDLAAVERLMNPRTCAVIVEPIQGEGGIHPATPEFLEGLRRLCSERRVLLIFDEVQCGLGRAGSLFAHQAYRVEPDIMTLAKSLGGGLAMGAMLTSAAVAEAFPPGSHASTMGGNPLTSAAALAYLKELIGGDYAGQARETGEYFFDRLEAALAGCDNVIDIRGRGLMIGIEIRRGGPGIVQACEEAGLLINLTAGTTLRLMPPLNVAREDIDAAVDILVPRLRAAED